jgi:hypothetical protein
MFLNLAAATNGIATVRAKATGCAGALGAAIVLASGIFLGSAQAATFSLTGGSAGTLSNFDPGSWVAANNNNIDNGAGISIFSNGSPGGLSVSGSGSVTFTYLGTEAAYDNQARTGATLLFQNHSTPLNTTSGSFNVSNALVPFLFRSINPGNLDANNGGSINAGVQIAFKLVGATTAYAFFEDIAIGGDHDFDDMVVRIDLSSRDGAPGPDPTPIPGALPLFGTGLGLIGLLGWRKKRKAQMAA